MMKRRGFLVNSTVIVLLIPILLLSATYSQVHYRIVRGQSEKMELEKLNWAVTYIDTDLRNTLQISGKRALLAMVNYTVSNRRFLSGRANDTMKKLMLSGKIEGVTSPLMGNQTLIYWFNAVSNALLRRGIILESSGNIEDNIEMTIVPLTSFQVAIKAKIKNVTLKDVNGKVLYRGSLPPRGYVYAVVDLRNVEDPVYAISTNGQYDRIVQPCGFSYPEVGTKPIKWLTGLGNASVTNLVGTYGVDIFFNNDTIWSNSPEARLFNLSANPLELFNNGDRGYLYFSNVSVPTVGNNWRVSDNYRYRVNFTVNNFKPNTLTLLVINTNSVTIEGKTMNQWVAHTDSKASILIYDSNGNPVNFWIEYWNNDGKLWLWIKTTDVNSYSLYLSNDPALETRGNPGNMFYLLDDFMFKDNSTWHFHTGTVSEGRYTFNAPATGLDAAISNVTFSPPFFVRWGMKTTTVNAGVGLYRPPTSGQNYLDVVINYGPLKRREIKNNDVRSIINSKGRVRWPYNYNLITESATLSSLYDMVNKLDNVLYDDTPWIYFLSDARTAKKWLDEQLAKINGTEIHFNYQIPIYLNATQVQGINYNPTTNSADIEIVDDRGNPVPFWIEYWNSTGALIWVRVNLTERYYTKIGNASLLIGSLNAIYNVNLVNGHLEYKTSLVGVGDTFYYITLNAYIGAHLKIIYNTGVKTRGDGDKVFEFFDDFDGTSLDTNRWNIEWSGGSYSISNGILTLTGDNNDTTSDIWLWTKKTFPESYVIGMRVKIGSSADQGWLWYIDSRGWGWMEDIYYDAWWDDILGHLYNFSVNTGTGYYQEDGGEYTADKWSYVELAIDAGDFTTYQDITPLVWNWSFTNQVSVYTGYNSESSEPVGLVQFKGSTEYDFIYVRKYLDLSYLSESITKHEASNRPLEYEFTGSSTQLAIWKNWEELSSRLDSVPSNTFNRYELNVSSSELNLSRVTGGVLTYRGDFSGTWNVSIVARGAGEVEFDWIIVGPPYVTSGVTFGTLESAGQVIWNAYASAAFDLQPFLNCLVNDRYFGLYEAPSFFERLEGKMDPSKTGINGEYWEASKKMQEELGIARDGHYYPIGLVSFIYYPADDDLVGIIPSVGQNSKDPQDAIRNSISFADYYWLSYYFNDFSESASSPEAYRVWGISMGTGDYSYLSGVGFLLDNTTAQEIFGSTAWNYLRYKG